MSKKADGFFGGCGSEANKEGIEVFEHLTPEVVDGAVAFINDNDIERFNRNAGVVGNRSRLVIEGITFNLKA